ncbi:MAG: hypothetical protein A2W20_04445 [Candidatus Aminicenantes bacterium RBG_16_66_30]|nr:MAG: hypothetical protein A2W20_04445 [Candidatus Aminicenantes bacterium RBG_16_66_30]
MSSHREAPAISKDPVADNTDLYAFVSPDAPGTVTILANFIPLEEPAGGPNFFQFGDDVLYEILIDNNGDSVEDITYRFQFETITQNPNTFLYNTGPITSLDSPAWNLRQSYSVTRIQGRGPSGPPTVLGSDLLSPPVRIGPRSTPNYPALANASIHTLDGGIKVFAGQRDEGFYVDLGSIFDLGTLRPFQNLHLIPTPAAPGRDDTKGFNVHTIAIQVPRTDLTQDGSNASDPMDPKSVIGVWASASRQKALIRDNDGEPGNSAGPWIQVSRLGNPLINEVVIPLGKKDFWNSQHPRDDQQFLQYYLDPELQNLLPVLYPGVFPNLAALLSQPPGSRPRADLGAILLTGIPQGIIPGFQNFTGATPADMLRLNVAIPPAASPSRLGILGGDLAGFPNGRRFFDDAVDIELRAVAGATYPLVAPSFTADAAAGLLADGLDTNDIPYLASFPSLPHPHEGYEHSHD